ncbi:MAG: methyltransferase, partial [bacterium]
VFISHVLHSYSQENILHLLRRVKGVLRKKGSVAIHEFLLADDRTGPLSGSLFSVNMLVNTSGGRSYSVSEIVSWMKKAGYQGMKKSFLEQTVVIQARRP